MAAALVAAAIALGNHAMRSRRFSWLCLAVVLVAIGWGAWWLVAERQFQVGLRQARADVDARRFERAGRWLAAQSARRLDGAEPAFLFGICEDMAGRHEAALAAWARGPLESRRGPNAAIARAQTLVDDLGRFAEAEAVLTSAVDRGDSRTVNHRYLLTQLLYWEGRLDEVRRLTQRRWGTSPNRAGDLRSPWQLDSAVVMVDSIQDAVEQAARKAPDDERVWLACANLALLRGHLPESARWLDAYLGRRPDDPVVWRAQLRWARAADSIDEARRASAHLPAEWFTSAEILRLPRGREIVSAHGSNEAVQSPTVPEAPAEEQAVASHEAEDRVSRARWLAALGGLVAGLASFGIGEALYQWIPAQEFTSITMGVTVRSVTGATLAVAAMRNAALAFGVLGLCLGGCLGIAGGLARRAAGEAGAAGLLGSILGAALGGGAAFATLLYLLNLQIMYPNYEVLISIAMHGLPWGLAGASAGLAFAVGLGQWRLLGLATTAGFVGAVLGAIAFDFIGAGFFPLAGTGDPISSTWPTRLLARFLVTVATAVAVMLILPGPAPAQPASRPEVGTPPRP